MTHKRKREKTKVVTFRASETDYKKWRTKADELGITLSEYITAALNKKRFNVKKLNPEFVREIAKIGNNLNQLARAVNTALKHEQQIKIDALLGEVNLIYLTLQKVLQKYCKCT